MTDADALLAELVALAPPVRLDGDIDAEQYAAALGRITPRRAAQLLDGYVEDGKLTRHKVYDTNKRHQVVVWRKVV